MKLIKKEAQKIAELYNLGRVKRIKKLIGGWNNDNFKISTEKGEFVYRFIGNPSNRDREFIMLKIVNFLKESDIPYKIPSPIKNIHRRFFSSLNKRRFWIYSWIPGRTISEEKTLSLAEIKEFARALARYHKVIKSFKLEKLKSKRNYSFYKNEFKKLEKIKPKNKTDKLMLKELEFFRKQLLKLEIENFEKEGIIIHTDFSQKNIIFRKNRVFGIIDFEAWEISTKLLDIAYTVKHCCKTKKGFDKKRFDIFLKEYTKYSSLSKKEVGVIPKFIVYDDIIGFWWCYTQLRYEDLRFSWLKANINRTKKFIKSYGKIYKI